MIFVLGMRWVGDDCKRLMALAYSKKDMVMDFNITLFFSPKKKWVLLFLQTVIMRKAFLKSCWSMRSATDLHHGNGRTIFLTTRKAIDMFFISPADLLL